MPASAYSTSADISSRFGTVAVSLPSNTSESLPLAHALGVKDTADEQGQSGQCGLEVIIKDLYRENISYTAFSFTCG
jgi:hypothetical protein